jgi:hypothetical protein
MFTLFFPAGNGNSQTPVPPVLPKIPSPALLQPAACDVFSPELYGVRVPYGSGSRTLEICINKCNFTPKDIEVIVFYSKTESQLNTIAINPAAVYGHGRARYLGTVGNIFRYEYTFPHSGFTDINGPGGEYKIIEMPSRNAQKLPQNVFFKIGVKRVTSPLIIASTPAASFEMPDPITIGMVGDSYAAGQGAPIQDSNLFTDSPQLWSDNDPETTTDVLCHRSYLSGQAQAAERIRRANKKLGIAVKFVSCSGAVVSNMAQVQQSTDGGGTVPLQFDLIKNWLNSKGYSQLDILLMGMGGNDAGFAQIVVDFMLNPFGNFHGDQDAQRRYADPTHGEYPFNDLNQAYLQADNDIRGGEFFNMSSIGKPILLQGYPSPCKGPVGNPFCGHNERIGNPVGPCWGPIEGDDRPAEFQDMHNFVLKGLNDAVARGARENGWVYIDLVDRPGNHGICNCSQPYFNTLGQSLSRQGDILGMVHPNSNGYTNIYVAPLQAAIQNSINEIQTYWIQFDQGSCARDEQARIAALKRLAIEAAKLKAAARARSKPYPRIKPYETYRKRYATEVKAAVDDIKSQIKSGVIKLAPLPVPDPATLRNIDFSDKFQK